MRPFVAILLSLSLSWVSMGYACEYATMGQAAQNMCCCHPAQAEQCPSPEHCQADTSQSGKACCDVVSLNGLQADDKALAHSAFLDFQPLAPPPALLDHTLLLTPRHSAPPIAWADDFPTGWGTLTYLQTARLRI
jgi:hypothetical protein